jgi:hypothetical protein
MWKRFIPPISGPRPVTRRRRAPAKKMGSVGPGTLLTVVLAIVGAEKGTALAAFTASPISVVGTVPTNAISRVLLEESEVSRKAEVSSTIAASHSSESAIVVPSACNLPNSRLPPLGGGRFRTHNELGPC